MPFQIECQKKSARKDVRLETVRRYARQMSEDTPGRMAEDMLERMLEDMPDSDSLPERTSEYMPEDVPYGRPEGRQKIYQTSRHDNCQNTCQQGKMNTFQNMSQPL